VVTVNQQQLTIMAILNAVIIDMTKKASTVKMPMCLDLAPSKVVDGPDAK
jgi:hypothetical protein